MQAKVPGDPGSHQQIVPYRPPEVVWSFSAVCSWPPRWGTTDSHCPGLSGGLSEALMQKLPHSVHQEQPDTVWAVRKSCQIQQADDFRDMSTGYRTPVITTTMKLGFRKEVNHIRNPVTSMSSCQTTQGTRVNRAQGALGSWNAWTQ
ncbi:uncharacterized protein LOC144331760 isoform X4 [Macaca mulatta]